MMMFFFSSRRRHTRCSRDWSSDVCSSDLPLLKNEPAAVDPAKVDMTPSQDPIEGYTMNRGRSEERRVGKECRSGWSPEHYKKKRGRGRQEKAGEGAARKSR